MTYIAKYAHFQKKKIIKKIEAAIRHTFFLEKTRQNWKKKDKLCCAPSLGQQQRPQTVVPQEIKHVVESFKQTMRPHPRGRGVEKQKAVPVRRDLGGVHRVG